ncbi:hypothetical protein C8F04DRAFT_1296585 [Mycena alexandri]|uniref:Uncharacterized protein n=1 Tax=Mycena alexandri TaxID=1745969 RepID=A0AAD6SEM8_9AGAR|nr:hypothetical protein C8F04DRAFT_1296585 [Mycena alexandri]
MALDAILLLVVQKLQLAPTPSFFPRLCVRVVLKFSHTWDVLHGKHFQRGVSPLVLFLSILVPIVLACVLVRQHCQYNIALADELENGVVLSPYLNIKRADHLLKTLLPCPPPPTLDEHRTQLPAFAARLAHTYTPQALLLHVNSVHGLWQNACVLGVHLDELWDQIDLAWEVLMTAMAISAGTAHLMLKRPSSPPPATDSVSSS